MKIVFLVFHGFSDTNGISKKIFYQVDGLRANGHEVDLCYYTVREDGHRIRMINDKVLQDYGCGTIAQIKKRIDYHSLYQYILQNKVEFVYVRSFHNANPWTINLFKKLRKKDVKIVMEIPTYPYDQEYIGFSLKDRLELAIDRLFRKQLAANLNAIVTFSDKKEIFGQRTLPISNGIDFSKIPLKKQINETSKEIHLIGVAEIHYWHGYDRIIHGLGEYYQQPHQKEVFLHLVGGIGMSEMQGSLHAPGFESIIKKYGISQQVIFHGQKFGKELDDLFEQADIAIGSLARHRSGITTIKTLKNREYAARGIPFIYSEIDSDFEQMPYIQKVSADETPINIQQLISFYERLKLSPQEIRDSIKNLSWKEQMGKVIKEISI